jgi:hypothetical protein
MPLLTTNFLLIININSDRHVEVCEATYTRIYAYQVTECRHGDMPMPGNGGSA